MKMKEHLNKNVYEIKEHLSKNKMIASVI